MRRIGFYHSAVIDAIAFYDRHPISERQVLDAVARRRVGNLQGLTADDLFDFDQDHYGGVAAVDALARRAGIGPRSRVLDVCAGLAGPARFLASRRACRVVGIEMNAGRALGARRLTARVGLASLVEVVRGDVTRLPFRTAAFDACVSQEALLHIADKPAVLDECRRVLVPGGRLVFTDWITRPPLSDGERRRLDEWMAATTLQSLGSYGDMLGRVGFQGVEAEDLSAEWRPLLRRRLEMYRALRADTVARFGHAHYEAYDQLYTFFVRLVEHGKLGGGRFTATR